jgi:NAD-dependent SIR2 family protein deacetylase
MKAEKDSLMQRAATAVRDADALLIAAGAGMGVDSGLPDFRGAQGFWRAYPPYQRLRLNFVDLANPRWFRDDPALAWGFYGHRFQLYRATHPHAGFAILRKWGARSPHGAFIFTSNVDGHFQRAGFAEERMLECHGSIHWLQCTGRCGCNPWQIDPAMTRLIDLDEDSMRARPPYPCCPACGALARPNILMFDDWQWDSSRTAAQELRLETWLRTVHSLRLAIIECGAGTAVPTVRRFSENIAGVMGATLIRVNVGEPHTPAGHVELAMGARDALEAIDRLIPS